VAYRRPGRLPRPPRYRPYRPRLALGRRPDHRIWPATGPACPPLIQHPTSPSLPACPPALAIRCSTATATAKSSSTGRVNPVNRVPWDLPILARPPTPHGTSTLQGPANPVTVFPHATHEISRLEITSPSSCSTQPAIHLYIRGHFCICDPRPSAAVWSRTPLCQASLDTTNAAGLPACSLNGRLNRRLSPDTNS
jgi:hypothetical protein